MIIDKDEKFIILEIEDFSDSRNWTKKDIELKNPFDFLKFLEKEKSLTEIQHADLIFLRDFRDPRKPRIYVIKNNYSTGDDPKLKEKYLFYGCEGIEDRSELLDL